MAEKSFEMALRSIPSAKVPGCGSNFDSLPLGSEPPDIRNWFSSYVYHSPDLDSLADCGGSVFAGKEESECPDLYVEDSEAEEDQEEKKTNFCRFAYNYCQKTEFNGSAAAEISDEVHHESKSELDDYSEALPSEPPDIRNWFSSYTYESPCLDSIKFGASDINTATDDSFEELDIEKDDQALRKLILSKAQDDMVHTHTLSFMGSTERKKSIIDDPSVINYNQKVDELQYESHVIDPVVKVQDLSSEEDEHYTQSLEAEQLIEGGEESAQFKCRNESGKESQSSKPSNVSECVDKVAQRINEESDDEVDKQISSGWILPNPKWRERCQSNLKEGTRYKKWEEDADCGFTSMKKIRRSQTSMDKNAMETKHQEETDKNRVALDVGKKGKETTIRTTVLAEMTNIQQFNNAPGVDVGKWRCPQKTKPYIGPPLKQLRLEQWVHRV